MDVKVKRNVKPYLTRFVVDDFYSKETGITWNNSENTLVFFLDMTTLPVGKIVAAFSDLAELLVKHPPVTYSTALIDTDTIYTQWFKIDWLVY